MRVPGGVRGLSPFAFFGFAFSPGFFARKSQVAHLPNDKQASGNQQDDNLDEFQ